MSSQQQPQSSHELIAEMGAAARLAARELSNIDAGRKAACLETAADLILAAEGKLLTANAEDLAFAKQKGIPEAMTDRLVLTAERIHDIAQAVRDIAALPDPVGHVMAEWQRPNGLTMRRVRVPLGVIGIVFESRPNVTADAGALCLKSGNAVILRCGSESLNSATVLAACLQDACVKHGLPKASVQLVPTRDRDAVGALLTRPDLIDVLIPRGGRSLVERVMTESRVPVLAHLDGLCHVYVDKAADLTMAEKVVVNAKMRRTSICGAAETLLVDQAIADTALTPLIEALQAAGCAIRGDKAAQAVNDHVAPATDQDWTTEYLSPVIAVKTVPGLAGAIDHINHYGSHHTDSIITSDPVAAARFLAEVDSAIVLHNASTQFADGGEFGFGAEIGIATGRLHARGPVGVEQLTTFKYQVLGDGQTRP
ncbi:MAG: glutamate-5-semialdehyde dehydrogenase [Pseudomonadota bacterium]